MKQSPAAELPKRALGQTGFSVTALGFGAMELRGPPDGPAFTDHSAEHLLNTVLDAGINFIDTSIDYGRSEELIGRFIAHRRSEYFLASKCGCVIGSRLGARHIHTPENIRSGVEHSLRRMKTDYLDLVQFHQSLTRRQLKDGALETALALKQEGKVRFVGISGTLPALVEQIEMGVFDAFQIPYSALQREHENIISRASALGAGIIIRGGVARGAPSDWQRSYYMLPATIMRQRWEHARLDELLDGMSRQEFTLRFTLSNPDLDTTIVGTKDLEHLRDNISATLKGPLPQEVVTEAKRRLAEAGSRPLSNGWVQMMLWALTVRNLVR
ncbi:MAG TPA: aldo/keto reductase [Candidatus Sulfotelmatobacter sp.]|nr:aldo/keto reductase [Candidatus Sulfotelmatobacter sp.]